jgi:cell division protein FtsW (lipid II flippase)
MKKNRYFFLMLLVTLFQFICLVEIIAKLGSDDLKYPAIAFGGYILLEWAYFAIHRGIMKSQSFEVELIGFFLSGIGLAITVSVYPEKSVTQLVAILIGFAGYLVLLWVLKDINLCMRLRYVAAVGAVGLLGMTLMLAQFTNGAKNWLYFGGMSIQPSELVKVAFVFVGAATLEKLQSTRSLTRYIIFAVACIGCLFMMYDFGTALIFFFTFIIISFLRSGDIRTIIFICVAALLGAVLILMFKPYVASRFASYTHIWEDPEGGGFQQTRALTYAASGGLFGLGLGNGELRNIFAATEDLVFGVVSEEFGLIIAFLIMLTYAGLLAYAIKNSKSVRSTFYAILSVSAAALLVFQAAVNVFGVSDLIPFTGVTLPFISRGGSSVMSCWMLLSFIKAVSFKDRQAKIKGAAK